MRLYQVFVRSVNGNTRCLQFESSAVSSDELKSRLFVLEGIPTECQRLVTGTRDVAPGCSLLAGADGWFPSCTLILRLRGGKGGFGSLLRGAATKAGQKKTSNFDACRDMSGRRLRHVNAEKKLKEWKSEAKERELEKTAEDFLKKKQKMVEEDSGVTQELEKFRSESLKARQDVGSAVEMGLAAAKKQGVDLKRKKVEAVDLQIKRARTWMDEDSDIDDSGSDVEGPGVEAGPSSDSAGSADSEDLPEEITVLFGHVSSPVCAVMEKVEGSKDTSGSGAKEVISPMATGEASSQSVSN